MEIVVLGRGELLLLWAIALLLPPLAHLVAHRLGRRYGVPSGRPLARILLLTVASVGTLLWLTASRFASVRIGEEEVTVRYAPPVARAHTIPRRRVADVRLYEESFPRHAYSLAIHCTDGRRYESVGVTPRRLTPLYRIFEAFHPGETPRVRLD